MSVTKKLQTSHIPVYVCWYEQDPDLLQFEKDCFARFYREYNNPELEIRIGFDKKHRFCVSISLPFKAAPELPMDTWKFLIVYDNDHPSCDVDGNFGGSIKVYPLSPVDQSFHYLMGRGTDMPYLCQAKVVTSDKVNGYYAMKRVLRWLVVYYVWKRTGVDIDKVKA